MSPSQIFLDKIKSIRYENRIVIVIDAALATLAGTDKIEFQSVIQDGKYVLIGPKVKQTEDQSKPWEVSSIVKAV